MKFIPRLSMKRRYGKVWPPTELSIEWEEIKVSRTKFAIDFNASITFGKQFLFYINRPSRKPMPQAFFVQSNIFVPSIFGQYLDKEELRELH